MTKSLPDSVHGLYLKALCTHASPVEACVYLEAHDEYLLDSSLKTTQEQSCDEATTYLLERMGDTCGAMRLMMVGLQGVINTLRNDGRGSGYSERAATALSCVARASELCTRSGAGNWAEAQRLWLEELVVLIRWQLMERSSRRAWKHKEALRRFAERLTLRLASKMAAACGSLHVVEVAFVRVFETHEATFSDVRGLVHDALRGDERDARVLRAANTSCSHDLSGLLQARHAAACFGRKLKPSKRWRDVGFTTLAANAGDWPRGASARADTAHRSALLAGAREEEVRVCALHWEGAI